MGRLIDADALKEKINKKIEAIELAIIFKDKNEKVEATLDEIHSFWCNAVDIIEAQPTASQWIPVSERLPEDEERKLVTAQAKTGRKSINIAWFDGKTWHGNGSMPEVTAWQPLPEPYKEDK